MSIYPKPLAYDPVEKKAENQSATPYAPVSDVVVAIEVPPTRRSVLCSPCRPLTYTIAFYLLFLEPIFTFFFAATTATFLIFGAISVPLCGFGLILMWLGLWMARIGTKFAAWCFSGLGAEVPHITALPSDRTGFFGLFKSEESWRAVLFILLVRPIIGSILLFIVKGMVFLAVVGLIGPIVAVTVASAGLSPGYVIAIAVVAFIGALLLAYCAVLAFPAVCGIFAWALRVTIGMAATRQPLVDMNGGYMTFPQDFSVQKASVRASTANMYGDRAAVRAFLVPSRPRRGLSCAAALGSCLGLIFCGLVVILFLAVATGVVLATLTAINCRRASEISTNSSLYLPFTDAPGALEVSLGPDIMANVRYTNDTSRLKSRTVPYGHVAVQLSTYAYGGATRYARHFVPFLNVAHNFNGVRVGVDSLPLKSSAVWTRLERWMMCPTAHVDIIVPASAVPNLATTSLKANVSFGVISTTVASHHGQWREPGDVTIRGLSDVRLHVGTGRIDLNSIDIATNGTAAFSARLGAVILEHLHVSPNTTTTAVVDRGEVEIVHLRFPPRATLPATVALNGSAVEAFIVSADDDTLSATVAVEAHHGPALVHLASEEPGRVVKKVVWEWSTKLFKLTSTAWPLATHSLSLKATDVARIADI